jgi:NADH dehydrogenase
MPALFLTGGTGFVGRALLARLLTRAGGDVTCLVRDPARLIVPANGRAPRVVSSDLGNVEALATAMRGCDVVLHLAASTGKATAAAHQRANLEGTRTLIAAAKQAGVRRLIYVSTIAAGFPDQRFYPYAASKAAAEVAVRESGLDWTIIRPTIVLGAGSPIGVAFAKLAGGPAVMMFGNGKVRVQPIDVSDLANVLVAVLDSSAVSHQTIDAGGPEEISFEKLLTGVRQRLRGTRTPVLHLPLTPLRYALAAVEPVLFSVLPLTAGQLAAFANDSVARPHPLTTALRPGMQSVDQMLAALIPA